jgi:hypothetical protein
VDVGSQQGAVPADALDAAHHDHHARIAQEAVQLGGELRRL